MSIYGERGLKAIKEIASICRKCVCDECPFVLKSRNKERLKYECFFKKYSDIRPELWDFGR